ncbi:MAG TPA: hypothetical protein PKE69_23365 [Pyrinomonadaceae bacterium]|nr:hypothetical protein [Pyrinomonadaceae bacterium]
MKSEETLKQHNEILEAIAALSSKIDGVNKRIDGLEDSVRKEIAGVNKRIDGLENYVQRQFEAVRQGIVDNAIRFDRLESQIYSVRSDLSNFKADIREARRELV